MAVLFNYTVWSVMICHSLNLGALFSQPRLKARKKKEGKVNPLKYKQLGLVCVTRSAILFAGKKRWKKRQKCGDFQKPLEHFLINLN